VAIGTLLAARPAAASGVLYLNLPGIVGSVTTEGHEGEIAVLSFSMGVSSPTRRVPAEVCTDLSVLKFLDQTSPLLFQQTLFGVDFKTATLNFVDTVAGRAVTRFTITLHNASMTSVQESGANEQPTELVSLHGTSWTATYFPLKSDGTPDAPASTTIRCQ
jgi:type VI secretion system Hcp family effector